ncbi:hypothetical protein CAPTEDRAFT_213737 [Capitella teleta]|uniref:Uncharacterized protein n=1 Tax=Capitella teleta TaxID=283909 RepID=R7T780_CAPTE|nr:hypothetical protein CAPTEDRAFT_213737 [Capitella teleta]|eukprot:ELT87245.1 hypothetical protein CAPTEDRAFT_213737 [Capitella teleta]
MAPYITPIMVFPSTPFGRFFSSLILETLCMDIRLEYCSKRSRDGVEEGRKELEEEKMKIEEERKRLAVEKVEVEKMRNEMDQKTKVRGRNFKEESDREEEMTFPDGGIQVLGLLGFGKGKRQYLVSNEGLRKGCLPRQLKGWGTKF